MSVRASTFGIAGQLLGRHVARRAEAEPRAGEALGGRATRRLLHRPRNAEVRENRVPVLEENVVRLQVAMHHCSRVRECQRLGDLAQEANHLIDRKRALLSRCDAAANRRRRTA